MSNVALPLWDDISWKPVSTATFTTRGTFTYTLPVGAIAFSLVAVGAGGGGAGTSFGAGQGGVPGSWAGVTYLWGSTQIPAIATTLTIVVGAAAAAVGGNTAGGTGGSSTVSSTFGTLLTAVGGGSYNGSPNGLGPGNFVFAGTTFIGGATQTVQYQNGLPPGGGGMGRVESFSGGFAGADGAVWIAPRF